jgi:hypothetical protein
VSPGNPGVTSTAPGSSVGCEELPSPGTTPGRTTGVTGTAGAGVDGTGCSGCVSTGCTGVTTAGAGVVLPLLLLLLLLGGGGSGATGAVEGAHTSTGPNSSSGVLRMVVIPNPRWLPHALSLNGQ